MANDFPKCRNKERDCRARDAWGRCVALVDTDFGDKPCPFYKQTTYKKEDLYVQKRQ